MDAPEQHNSPLRHWTVRGKTVALGRVPLLMGIVNVTPDSFSDGGCHATAEAAVAQALKLAEEGADILDIGGESTRPGADLVPEDEELRRVIPVVESLRAKTDRWISIDTRKAVVARAAVAAGADIINDVSGGEFDLEMPATCAATDAGFVCMHMRGTPLTMRDLANYDDVVGDVVRELEQHTSRLVAAGMVRDRVLWDPGIGFAKTAEQNLRLLSNVAALRATGRPVLIGHSRKRFLKSLLGRDVEERLCGTLGVAIAVAEQHADVIRVHDVQATRDTLLAWRTVREGRTVPTASDSR
jgi:dihydropteroate synthase